MYKEWKYKNRNIKTEFKDWKKSEAEDQRQNINT
jgi:hypothetical protein